MQIQDEIGGSICRLAHAIRLHTDSQISALGVSNFTPGHCHIIGYLLTHQDRDVFQKDLEQCLHVKRSAISTTLSLMEKNQLIQRIPVSQDARLKKIIVTPQGEAAYHRVSDVVQKTEQLLRQSCTEEELEALLRITAKMQNTLASQEEPF